MRKHFSSNNIYIFILILVPIGFGLWALKLGQDTNWDLLNYHIYNPYALLNGRIGYDLAPAGVQTHYNPLIDVLYYKAINLLNAKLLGFILGFLQGLDFIVLYFICQNIIKPLKISNKVSLFLALTGVFTVVFLSEVGTSFHDSLTALFSLSSLLIIISNVPNISSNKRNVTVVILIAGIIAGIGAGLKLVVLIFAFALFLSFFVLPISWRNRFKLSIIFGVGVAFGWLLSGGYWAYLMWSHFGNPMFPHFNDIFHGEFTVFESLKDERFLPKSLFEKVFYPIIFTIDPHRISEIEYKQISWFFLYILLIIFGGYKLYAYLRKKATNYPLSTESRFIISYICFAYFLWLNMFGINRYLVSLELLIPLVIFIVITNLSKSKWVTLIAICFIGIITLVNLRGIADWGRTGWETPAIRLEPNELQETEPSAIFLGGLPLAWVAPSVNSNAPFIQAVPNFPVSSKYWQRAEALINNRTGKLFIILESDKQSFVDDANKGLSNIGLTINDNSCRSFNIYLGKKLFDYKYCEVLRTE